MGSWQSGLLAICVCAAAVRGAEQPRTFGRIRAADDTVHSIAWQAAPGVSVTGGVLRFTTPGASIKSVALPLHPLRLYDMAVTMRRGPGTRIRFMTAFEDDKGTRGQRGPVWQCPERSRANWFPLSPYRQRYVQGLVLPPRTKRVWLELKMDGPEKPELTPYTGWDLFDLEFVERQAVPLGARPGVNHLPEGSMESMGAGNVPAGWGVWGQGADRLQVVEARAPDRAPHGRHFLRVRPGRCILLAARNVPVKRGTAWRMSLWARGKGSMSMMAQLLDGRKPQPYRVGDAQGYNFTVDGAAWKQFDALWFAESPHVKNAQVVVVFCAEKGLDVDHVEFRPLGK